MSPELEPDRRFVIDASIVVDLLARFRPEPIEALLLAQRTRLAAPELLDIEVMQALRRLEREGRIPSSRSGLAQELLAMPIRRFRHQSLVEGIWSLRGQLTAYDAAYVSLAKILDATLLTRDQRLARASGLADRVIVPV